MLHPVSHLSRYLYCPYDGQGLIMDAPDGRPKCPRCEFIDYQNPKPCVAILIVRNDKVLFARRGIEPAKGMWDIPGGFIDAGESAEEAVVREAREETTLQVRVAEFLGSVPDIYGTQETPTLNLCFLVEVIAGEPVPKSDVEALAWFSFDQLPAALAFAHQKKVIELLRPKISHHV